MIVIVFRVSRGLWNHLPAFVDVSGVFAIFRRVFFEFSCVFYISGVFRVFRGPWDYLRVFEIFGPPGASWGSF